MKRLIIALFLLSGCATPSDDKTATLTWEPSPSLDVAYYKIYVIVGDDTTLIGTAHKDTMTIFEPWEVLFTPGVSAVDSAGNESRIHFSTDTTQ